MYIIQLLAKWVYFSTRAFSYYPRKTTRTACCRAFNWWLQVSVVMWVKIVEIILCFFCIILNRQFVWNICSTVFISSADGVVMNSSIFCTKLKTTKKDMIIWLFFKLLNCIAKYLLVSTKYSLIAEVQLPMLTKAHWWTDRQTDILIYGWMDEWMSGWLVIVTMFLISFCDWRPSEYEIVSFMYWVH